MNISVSHPFGPLQIKDIIHTLEIHSNSFDTISDLHWDGIEFDSAGLLKIGELGDLHSIQPDLPTQAPGTECRRFPIIFDKTDVMTKGVNAKKLQTVEIDLLNIKRRGFDDDLILIIVLKPIRILSVPTIGWTPRRFYICHLPWLRPYDPEAG